MAIAALDVAWLRFFDFYIQHRFRRRLIDNARHVDAGVGGKERAAIRLRHGAKAGREFMYVTCHPERSRRISIMIFAIQNCKPD